LPAAPFTVHTRWIETESTIELPPYAGPAGDAAADDERTAVTVEVGGRRLEVVLPGDLGLANDTRRRKRPAAAKRAAGGGAVSGDSLTAPMQGTIVKVAVEDGQQVAAGDLVVVLEAMKMEQPLTAHKDGTISGLSAQVGAPVQSGAVICQIT
jgi:acetyl-CoA/propionyl-CoA carboxylase biotin carboxyl carrier protein